MFRRVLKISIALVGALIVLASARYLQVQKQIKNYPIEITQYSKSGYTPEGVYGHGDLSSTTGEFGWYIYDVPDAEHGVRKACVYNVTPEGFWDVDFIYVNKSWYKLRSGHGTISGDGFTSDPATQKWKGVVSSKVSFPVRKLDVLYKAKVIFSKLKGGSLSPLEYLQRLKITNPSCADIPAP